jgi:hypothetical protein
MISPRRLLSAIPVLLALLFVCCSPAGPQVLILSYDGKTSIMAPPDWNADSGLVPAPQLQASNRSRDEHVTAFVERKMSKISLQEYSMISLRGFLMDMTKPITVQGPTSVKIDGKNGLQYEIHAMWNGKPVGCIHTALQGEDEFFEILAWTGNRAFDSDKQKLLLIVNSFREIQKSQTQPVKS